MVKQFVSVSGRRKLWEQTSDSGCEVVMIQTRSAAEKPLMQVASLLYSREGNIKKILEKMSVLSKMRILYLY